jgi:hypothetical protein
MGELREYEPPKLFDIEGRLLKSVLMHLRPLTGLLEDTLRGLLSRREQQWSFAELAIEGMYQRNREQLAKQGYILTRLEFWNTPGQMWLLPAGYMQLMKAGLTEALYGQQFAQRVQRPPIAPNRLH